MTDKKIDLLIDSWIESNKAEVLKKWIGLAEIPSISSEPEEKAPFGKQCARALSYAADLFSSKGFECTLEDEGGYALAHLGEGEKQIGIFCHSDVVPVGEGWLYTEPFTPVIKEGALIGRGVEDNKSGIMHAYCAYNFFKDNNISLKNRLTTFIGSDEECGMKDMDAYLSANKPPELSIVPDAEFPCSVGEKGIYHFLAKSRNAFESVLEFSGGEAYNIVLDNATAVLKYSSELEKEIVEKAKAKTCYTVRADEKTISIRAKGVAKHASIPDGSLNAALLISELLCECSSLSEGDRELFANIRELLSSDYGQSIGVAHEDPVFGKLTSVNGMVRLRDNRPVLSFDVRYGSTLSPELLVKESTRTLLERGFEVVEGSNSPGFAINPESKVPDIFENIYQEVTGERLERITMAGGTYARRLDNAFSIGTYAIRSDRETPCLSMPAGHGGAHQCDEMIDIDGFFTALKILIHCILACDELL